MWPGGACTAICLGSCNIVIAICACGKGRQLETQTSQKFKCSSLVRPGSRGASPALTDSFLERSAGFGNPSFELGLRLHSLETPIPVPVVWKADVDSFKTRATLPFSFHFGLTRETRGQYLSYLEF